MVIKKNKCNLPDLFSCTICVIGLGYVGLPLAIEFSRVKKCLKTSKKLNRKIIGFDLNKKRVEELISGIDSTEESDEESKKEFKSITFINDKNADINADIFIISVPTPIDHENNPDLSFLKNATELVANFIIKRDKITSPIFIIESTVYPGTTEEICVPIIENITGLKYNKDFFCGYSPERINPGDKNHNLTSIVKVTSGSNSETASWINDFYGSIIKAGTFKSKSIRIAEAAKVFENTQRDINIALVNELAKICKTINIDTLDVLNAAESKWNFLSFRPGLVGGHCISVDPYYLTYVAKKNGYTTDIVLAGRNLNDGMSSWVIKEILKEATKKKIKISNSKILVLGLTFKENCKDIRNSKAIDLIKILNKENNIPYIYDPFIKDTNKLKNFDFKFLNRSPLLHKDKYDIVIIATAHDEFKKINSNIWSDILNENYIIYDLKGIIPRCLNPLRI
ncbi:nucleotide sugar dehydrogenase [Prochlorococcus sp. AH-736-N03]|nr:nucleotide sugar dehydrogenase [Prochlorococcus sp. AH-736-N03]